MNFKTRGEFSIGARLLFGVSYAITTIVALSFIEIDRSAFAIFRSTAGFLVLSSLVSLSLVAFIRTAYSERRLLNHLPVSALFPVGILVIAMMQLLSGSQWFKSYGDGGSLATIINESKPFSRWLLGSTALIDLFGLINHFVLSISAQHLVVSASAACMCASSIVILKKYGNRSYVLLPLTTPIWLAFSFGYDEYYPFIVGIFMVVTLWILTNTEHEFSYIHVVLIGALPAIYVGFIPLAVFALAKNFAKVKTKKQFVHGFALSAFAYLVSIEIGWPSGHTNYLAVLSDNMNLGNTHEVHNYQGMALSSKSPFYSIQSVFSSFHFRDLMFNAFFATGVVFFLLLILIIAYIRTGKDQKILEAMHGYSKIGLFMLFVCWNTFYFIFMIPKLGPINDIDLFFASNLIFAILCGVMLEKWFEFCQFGIRAKINTLSAIVALNGPIVSALVVYGIRR